MPHNPAQTAVHGAAESTGNVLAGRAVRDVASRIAYLDPSAAPFTLLLAKARKSSATNTKFEWQEKDLAAKWDAVNGTTGTGTSIVVDDAARFNVRDIVKVVRTGELMLVTAVVTSTQTLTVVRGVGETSTAAVADNDDLLVIGQAFAEGATSVTPRSHLETQPFNYTQIFRNPLEVTGTEAAMENYSGADRPRLRREKAIEHKIDIERAFLFGERNRLVTGAGSANNPLTLTRGFDKWATLNRKAMGGTMTEPELEDWCEDLFGHTGGSDTRTLFVSALAASVMNQLSAARIRTVPREKVYGLAVSEWITFHGTLMIIKHRLLESGPTSGQGYGGYMFAVEPSKLGYRFLRGRDTKLLVDIQANDSDTMKDEYLTEAGFQFENPALHGVATGITG